MPAPNACRTLRAALEIKAQAGPSRWTLLRTVLVQLEVESRSAVLAFHRLERQEIMQRCVLVPDVLLLLKWAVLALWLLPFMPPFLVCASAVAVVLLVYSLVPYGPTRGHSISRGSCGRASGNCDASRHPVLQVQGHQS